MISTILDRLASASDLCLQTNDLSAAQANDFAGRITKIATDIRRTGNHSPYRVDPGEDEAKRRDTLLRVVG